MKINPEKSKAVSFTKVRVKERLRYYFGEQLIPEASSFKYLGIIIHNELNWADHLNYPYEKHGRHFISYCVYSEKRKIIIRNDWLIRH
jgi:hypothetical protein